MSNRRYLIPWMTLTESEKVGAYLFRATQYEGLCQ